MMAYNQYAEDDLKHYQPKVVFVDAKNQITRISVDESPFTVFQP